MIEESTRTSAPCWPIRANGRKTLWRRGADSNRRIEVLQGSTAVLSLTHFCSLDATCSQSHPRRLGPLPKHPTNGLLPRRELGGSLERLGYATHSHHLPERPEPRRCREPKRRDPDRQAYSARSLAKTRSRHLRNGESYEHSTSIARARFTNGSAAWAVVGPGRSHGGRSGRVCGVSDRMQTTRRRSRNPTGRSNSRRMDSRRARRSW